MIQIIGIECFLCGKEIWYNNGNIEDFTVDDVESVTCPFCGEDVLVIDTDSLFYEAKDLEAIEAKKAYKTPNEAWKGEEEILT